MFVALAPARDLARALAAVVERLIARRHEVGPRDLVVGVARAVRRHPGRQEGGPRGPVHPAFLPRGGGLILPGVQPAPRESACGAPCIPLMAFSGNTEITEMVYKNIK